MRHAVILGGSRGLGASLGCQLRQMGVAVTVISRSPPPSYRCEFIRCDLVDIKSVESVAVELSTIAPFDSFYWVAGEFIEGPVVESSPAAIVRLVDVNLKSGLVLSIAAWRRLWPMGRSALLVVVSSTSGVLARQNQAAYCTTKFAQVGFARSVGLETTEFSPRVTLVMPGGMLTNLWVNHPARDTTGFLSPDYVAKMVIAQTQNQTEGFHELSVNRQNGR